MIEDQNLVEQLLDIMQTLLKGSAALYVNIQSQNHEVSKTLGNDMYETLTSIQNIAEIYENDTVGWNLSAASASVKASLGKIMFYEENNPVEALHKIEFELIPLLEDMRMNFHFFEMVWPDKEKMDYYYANELDTYDQNVYLEQSKKTGEYRYELSVCLLAYNNLEYSKLCIESLKKYMPENLNYELILVSDGSTDGTAEYFESICPDKLLNVTVNGGGYMAFTRIIEGKYTLFVSNDVIVTENAIENMLKCIKSDEQIAWVVATTPNISNYQNIPLEYGNMEELWEASRRNNISDPYRWEQRVRLCNPIDLSRSDLFHEIHAYGYSYSKKAVLAFPDDRMSLLCRRNGYKIMLAKDAYCHHFGSVSIGKEVQKKENTELYQNVGREFFTVFGIDPWGKGMCYDSSLFRELPIEMSGHVEILGINAGLGSNPLKIKEALKECMHNTDVVLYNYTIKQEEMKDLKGISDISKYLPSWEAFEECNEGRKYQYLMIENGFGTEDEWQKYLKTAWQYVAKDGYMIICLEKSEQIEWVRNNFSNVREVASDKYKGIWLYWKNGGI